jgi:hypothetical protein
MVEEMARLHAVHDMPSKNGQKTPCKAAIGGHGLQVVILRQINESQFPG